MPYEERYRKKMVLGQDGNHLVNLITVIAVIFLVFKFIFIIYHIAELNQDAYYKNVFNWFILPGDVHDLMDKPWTIVTYMFMHDGVFYVIANLLWIWAFGFILQDLAGNGKIIPVFLYGSFAGALFFVLSYSIFRSLGFPEELSVMQGAAPGIIAIAVATTSLAPDYRIFPMINGGIPLWVLTILFVIIDFATVQLKNTSVYISHLSSAAMGFVLILQFRKGRDWTIWMNQFFNRITNLFNPDKHYPISEKKKKHFYRVGNTRPFTKVPNITQKRIDEILDKINQKGFRFLSDEEKEILKRASQDDNL